MNDVRQLWSLVRGWIWLIALGTVIGGVAGYAVSRSLVPEYRATATLLVNQAQTTTGLANYNDVLTSERLARTYGELIRQRPVIEQVIADLRLPTTYETLIERIDVRPVRETQLIEIAAEHPDPQLAADIANAAARTFIGRLISDQAEQTASTREVLAAQIADLDAKIRSTSEAIERARQPGSDTGSSLVILQAELNQHQLAYAQMLRNQQEIALNDAKAAASVRMTEPAVVPTRPVRPNVPLHTAAAAAAGLLLCVGLVWLREHLDDAVRTPERVEQVTGLHTLGSVALLPGRAKAGRLRRGPAQPAPSPVLVISEARSPHAEAFRILRTNIEFAQVHGACRTLMVTSANPGEGKSTVAANLAAVIAGSGKRVMLVDADLRRPTVHKVLGLENRMGLTTLFASDLQPMDVIQTSEVHPALRVLTSGPIPPNPAELLGSARMNELIEKLQGMVDLVLFDSPPVLAVADPTVLASRVDGVVVVADSEGTSADALHRATDALRRTGATMLGVVLNRLTARAGGYYQQYYQQEYGSQSSDEQHAWAAVSLADPEPVPAQGSPSRTR